MVATTAGGPLPPLQQLRCWGGQTLGNCDSKQSLSTTATNDLQWPGATASVIRTASDITTTLRTLLHIYLVTNALRLNAVPLYVGEHAWPTVPTLLPSQY